MDSYPDSPGFTNDTTSLAAAEAIKPTAQSLRNAALAVLSKHARSADEVASDLCQSVLSIRPRITELKRLGLIKETGLRWPNASGRLAHVYVAARKVTHEVTP